MPPICPHCKETAPDMVEDYGATIFCNTCGKLTRQPSPGAGAGQAAPPDRKSPERLAVVPLLHPLAAKPDISAGLNGSRVTYPITKP